MRKNYLYFFVAISGASTLTIEILGTRILGPFYGTSLFLWSALISVTLAALSLGYALGGRWADRGATLFKLSWLLVLAGLWIIGIPWLKRPILLLTESVNLRFAVLATAAILFFPPLTLLGMVSPYAIKLKTSSLTEIGRTAGNLYAISTVASVISALLTGFLLIPNVGVAGLTVVTGLILLLTAIPGLLSGSRPWLKVTSGISIFLILLLAIPLFPVQQADPAHGLLFIKQSPYGEIRVVEENSIRYLLIDGSIHTMVRDNEPGSLQRYAVALDLTKFMFEKSGKMLLIGLGGGALVPQFVNDNWQVDAVEIDPVVIEAAEKHFSLNPATCRIFCEDGRRFLKNNTETYDLIILDAFGSSSIPFHLTTTESFARMKSHLAPNGIFALNVECIGWDNRFIRSLALTLKNHFQVVTALPTDEPPDVLGNVVLLAADRELTFPEEWLANPVDFVGRDPYAHWFVVQQNHAWANRFTPKTTGALCLTDDLNPVDIWGEGINFNARKELHSFFRGKVESW